MKQFKMKQKKKGWFLRRLFGTLGASLLGNMLAAGKRINTAGYGSKDLRSKGFQFNKRKGIIRASYGSKFDF